MKPQDKPYTMAIYQLRELHRSMRKAGADVAAFDFVFEDVTSSVLFMTDVAPFRLVFYKRSSKERLEIEVVPGYMIRLTQSREAEIRRYFEMPTGGWQSMLFKRLADALRAQTPVEFVPPRASERQLIAKARKVPEADKIYFCGLRVWPAINARNGEKEWHRNPRNLEKVKLLDPQIYRDVKDRDISVCYTDDPARAVKWVGIEGGYTVHCR